MTRCARLSKLSVDLHSAFGLTPTEAVVAALLNEGLAYSEIAEKLRISYNTVHTHTKAIHRKVAVPTTGRLTALIRAARANRDDASRLVNARERSLPLRTR